MKVNLCIIVCLFFAGYASAQGKKSITEIKALTNERIFSLVKSGTSDNTVISLISQFPSEFDIGQEALDALRDAGISEAVINAMKRRTSGRSPKKLQPASGSGAVSTRRPAPAENTAPDAEGGAVFRGGGEKGGKYAFGLNYPGAGLRMFYGGNCAAELKIQYVDKITAGGLRLYFYPRLSASAPSVRFFWGLEGAYISFKSDISNGAGYAAAAFAGAELFLSGRLSLQADIGPAYVGVTDRATSANSAGLDFVANSGINFYF